MYPWDTGIGLILAMVGAMGALMVVEAAVTGGVAMMVDIAVEAIVIDKKPN